MTPFQAACHFPSKPHPTPIDGSQLHNHGYNWGLDDVRQYFGIWSVCIVYTSNPFYPPIPFKCRSKSVYGCCKAVLLSVPPAPRQLDGIGFQCMLSNHQGFCRHTRLSDRAFKVNLTSGKQKACKSSSLQSSRTKVDLELALENGAALLRVYAIWDYGKTNVTTDMYRNMMMVGFPHFPLPLAP